jgi:hypothetical protein
VITAISPPQGGETASSPYRGVLVNERSRPFESSRNVSPVTDDALGGPALGETLRGWLAARKEIEAHLANDMSAQLTAEWIQNLSDLLATERAWEEKHTELLSFGGVGKFPDSRR